MAPDRTLKVDVVGARLVVREWGDEAATPLVFWHGLTVGGPWQLNEAGPLLAERHRLRVIAPSAPGWETPVLAKDDYRLSALARRVVALLDALDVATAVYAGYSWGANVGVHLGAAAPERLHGLALLDSGYLDSQDYPAFDEEQLGVVPPRPTFDSLAAAYDAVRGQYREWRPAIEERLQLALVDEDGAYAPRVDLAAFAHAVEGLASEPPSEALPLLARAGVRVLLLVAGATVAEEWAAAGLERFRRALPDADVRTLDSGHDVLTDALEETVAAVGAFAEAVTISRA